MSAPDPDTIRLHAVMAVRRGLDEFVRSFKAGTPEVQLDHQVDSFVSLNRGIESLAKYWLYLKDPALVVIPRGDDYLKIRTYIAEDNYWQSAHTISGSEALSLLEKINP